MQIAWIFFVLFSSSAEFYKVFHLSFCFNTKPLLCLAEWHLKSVLFNSVVIIRKKRALSNWNGWKCVFFVLFSFSMRNERCRCDIFDFDTYLHVKDQSMDYSFFSEPNRTKIFFLFPVHCFEVVHEADRMCCHVNCGLYYDWLCYASAPPLFIYFCLYFHFSAVFVSFLSLTLAHSRSAYVFW